MDINSINAFQSAATQQAQSQKTGKNEMGQSQFMQLLVAQMQNQDPVNPMDGSQFAAQLAQFNSVEQLINVNDGLKVLQQSQDMMSASLSNSMAASLTGKQVKAMSNQVHLDADGNADISYKLKNSADKVEIIIRNESGGEVRRETLEGVAGGENSWNWDGLNNNGDRMGEGNYTVEINASSGDNKVNSMIYVKGVADKVRYTGNGVYLTVNNIEVPIGDVEEVGIDIF